MASLLAGCEDRVPTSAELIGEARAALKLEQGVQAEVRLREAMNRGASRQDVAALMGQAFLIQGDLDQARRWLAPGNFTMGDAAEGFRALGRLERRQGNLPAAGRAYDKALTLRPTDASLWVEIARLRYAGGETVLAVEATRRAYQLKPTDPRVLELNGQVVRDQAGLQASLPWFERGLEKQPNDMPLLGEYAATIAEMGRTKDALIVTRHMIGLDSRFPTPFLIQAAIAGRAGKIELARSIMNRTRGQLDDVPNARLVQAALDVAAGNPASAADSLTELTRSQPANHTAQILLARALYASGDYRVLVNKYGPIAERDDATAYLQVLVARAYENLAERDKAAALLDKAAMHSTPFVSPVMFGSPLGTLIAGGDLPAAQALAEAELGASPGSADANSRAGDVQLASGNPDAALKRYRVTASAWRREDLVLRMAQALLLVGQGVQAQGLIENYLVADPGSSQAARMAAMIASQQGDWKRTQALLANVRKNGGNYDVRLLCDLAFAEHRLGNSKAALGAARRAFALQPSNPYAAQVLALGLATNGQRPSDVTALLDKAQAQVGVTPLITEVRGIVARR